VAHAIFRAAATAAAPGIGSINNDNIKITRKPLMLEAVVKHKHLCFQMIDGPPSGGKSIGV